jgi:hypothetical protein
MLLMPQRTPLMSQGWLLMPQGLVEGCKLFHKLKKVALVIERLYLIEQGEVDEHAFFIVHVCLKVASTVLAPASVKTCEVTTFAHFQRLMGPNI